MSYVILPKVTSVVDQPSSSGGQVTTSSDQTATSVSRIPGPKGDPGPKGEKGSSGADGSPRNFRSRDALLTTRDIVEVFGADLSDQTGTERTRIDLKRVLSSEYSTLSAADSAAVASGVPLVIDGDVDQGSSPITLSARADPFAARGILSGTGSVTFSGGVGPHNTVPITMFGAKGDSGITAVAVSNSTSFWESALSNLKTNKASIFWNVTAVDVTHAGWGFYDDATLRGSSHLVAVVKFGVAETTLAGSLPYVSPGDFSLRIKDTSTRIFPSDYLCNKILDHLLQRTTFTPVANLTLRSYTVAPTAAGGGTESTYTGYSAQSYANNLTTWNAATSRTKTNAIALQLPTSTSSESTVATALWGGSDLYCVCTPASPVSVVSGKGPQIAASAFNWTWSAS